MTFNEFKSDINIIESCEPKSGWNFEQILSLLENVVVDLDKIDCHVTEGVDRIIDKLDQ